MGKLNLTHCSFSTMEYTNLKTERTDTQGCLGTGSSFQSYPMFSCFLCHPWRDYSCCPASHFLPALPRSTFRRGDKNCHSSLLGTAPEASLQVFRLCVWPVFPGLTSLYTLTGYFHVHSNEQLKKKLGKKKKERKRKVIRLKWKLKSGSKWEFRTVAS